MKEAELTAAKQTCDQIVDGVAAVFVGHKPMLRKLLAGGLANGHILFEDNPGLGKTLLAKAFARVIGFDYARIQFTPDLLPADIVGTRVWRQKDAAFELMRGPIFTNILLADEINRTPPKTQAALLEAMEERQVTIEGETNVLQSAIFCTRHAKSDRAGRNVSSAGSTDGSFHAEDVHGLCRNGRGRKHYFIAPHPMAQG